MNATHPKNNQRTLTKIPLVSNSESKHAIKISNFLLKEERDQLFEMVCKNQSVFNPLGNPDADGDATLHVSLGPENDNVPEIESVREACACVSNRIEALLPKIFEVLNVDPFPVSTIPLSIGNGLNGHTGSVHTDESGGRFQISLLYYFHKIPKAFQGGALELFAPDQNTPSGHAENAFEKIEHEDNVLIAFPSETYHGVTDVRLNSTKFEEGRFIIVGFLGSQ